MDFALLLLTFLLGSFALLAVFDGLYLHMLKYELHMHKESKNEHVTHTVRAFLFVGILYFLFLNQESNTSFFIGMAIVLIDVIVLGIDAYMEHDSRSFMGGLPRWEYILHLFVNGLHFASIAVMLALKIELMDGSVILVHGLSNFGAYDVFSFLVVNLLPGSILIAFIHILVMSPRVAQRFSVLKMKYSCC